MKKLLLSALVGGIVLFLWGWLTWVLPVHSNSIRTINNEEAVVSALKINIEEKGVYTFPGMKQSEDPAVVEEWKQKYEEGPVGMIIYDPEGKSPMNAGQIIIGLIISILSAYFTAWFLSRSTAAASSYLARVAYCGMLGIFISVAVHLVNWNWMDYPIDYTVGWIIDAVIGWLIAGLVIASIIKVNRSLA